MTTTAFRDRVRNLPRLGLGISTEFDAGRTGLDVCRLAELHPELVGFLEIGADLERGIDEDAEKWVASGRPTTYHFLDVNLEEAEDLDDDWIADTAALVRRTNAAWICGDAGLWHVGPRERGHGILMPPILVEESARAMADAVRTLHEKTGFEIVPENPPAHVFLGDMHLVDYFSLLADRAQCGLLLDVAHLAIYQRAAGHQPLTALDGAALDHVIEVHVAGGTEFLHEGKTFVDDDHGLSVLDDTWEIFSYLAARAPNLKAVVIEGERNSIEGVLPLFRKAKEIWDGALR